MGRVIFSKFWPIIKVLIYFFKLFPDFISRLFLSFSSVFSGSFAIFFRYLLFSSRVKKFDKNTYVGVGVVLKGLHMLQVGANLSIHDMCYIDAQGGLIIGDNVSIAHQVSILTFNHVWSNPDLPIKYNSIELEPVVIEDDVWIGCGVRIMPGVTIGRRSVVAAGAVVTKDIPAGSLVAGIPAKLIKSLVS